MGFLYTIAGIVALVLAALGGAKWYEAEKGKE